MCCCCEDSGFGLLYVCKKIFDGVLIKTSPVFLNRVTDRFGMRGQEKSGHVDQIRSQVEAGAELLPAHRRWFQLRRDRKSTRLNSSHLVISYAVFCLKKKK